MKLEDVAAAAGYTRGAIYHQFVNKEELASEVVTWVAAKWYLEVWETALREADPVLVLTSVARAHVTFCRRDIARVMMALRAEFEGQDHQISEMLQTIREDLVEKFAALLDAARDSESIARAIDSHVLARAGLGAIEGLAIEVAGKTEDDVVLAERVIRALLRP